MDPSPSHWMHRTWAAPLAAALLVLLLHSFRLGDAPLAGTEAHRAIVADQMVHGAPGASWLLPHLHGELYLRKPPLHYWILASVQTLIGVGNLWVWRLVSVVAMTGLAAVMARWARRWWGPPADWIAGLGLITLLPLWAQTRSADIDAMNTLTSVVAAMALIEIGFGPALRRLPFALLAAGALSATLLLKGHAGLPVVGGALLGASVLNRQWRWLLRPSLWGSLLASLVLPGVWLITVRQAVQRLNLAMDMRGVAETRTTLVNLADLDRTLSMPLLLTLFCLPLALLLLVRSNWEQPAEGELDHDLGLPAGQVALFRACTGAYLGGLVLCLLNGVGNPRYGYMLAPMLALAAGAVAASWRQGVIKPELARALGHIMAVTSVIAAIATVAVAAAAQWQPGRWHWDPWLLVTAVGAVAGAVVGFLAWRRRRPVHVAWTACLLMALLSIPVAQMNNATKAERSGWHDARLVTQTIDAGATLHVGKLLWDRPELLYYIRGAAFKTHRHGLGWPSRAASTAAADGNWVLLDQHEWKSWQNARVPGCQVVKPLDAGVLVRIGTSER